jgi:hypothetical protein
MKVFVEKLRKPNPKKRASGVESDTLGRQPGVDGTNPIGALQDSGG